MEGIRVYEIRPQEIWYTAVPLPTKSRSIRVLDLEPSIQYNNPLVGALRVISLDEKNCCPFNALSYTWGNPEKTHTLWLSNVPFEITTNCYEALRQLRHNYGAITIWVDAICIDQTNDREKEFQLPLMGEIYMWAEVVYIWLGMETENSLKGLKILADAATLNYLPVDPDRTSRNPPSWSEKAKFTLKLLPPYLGYNTLKAIFVSLFVIKHSSKPELDELLGRPWFSRAWTFQEIVLASEAVVLCGPAAYRLDVLVRGLEYLNESTPLPSYGSRFIRAFVDFLVLIQFHDRGGTDSYVHTDHGLTEEGEAFRRASQLWLSVDRPIERNGRQVRRRLRSGRSFNDYQKPYNDIHDFLIWDTWYGIYINSLIAHGTLVLPVLLILGFALNTGSGIIPDFVIIVGVAIASSVLHRYLPRRRPRRKHGSTQSKDDFVVEGVVQALRQRQASVPKDRSYALYGILNNLQLELPRPDYRKSRGLVYHELFTNLLRWKPSFVNLLLDCGQQEAGGRDAEMRNAPTWVPDWSQLTNDGAVLAEYFLAGTRTINVTSGMAPYARLPVGYNPRELFVRGQWVGGRIVCCTDKFEEIQGLTKDANGNYDASPYNMNILGWALANMADWISTARSVRAATGSASSWFASSRRVVAGTGLHHQLLVDMSGVLLQTSHTYSVFPDRLRSLCEIMFQAESDDRREHSSSTVLSAIVQAVLRDRDTLFYCCDEINHLSRKGQRLFVTSDGAVGCAYGRVGANDRLALVAGAPAPLVLRPGGGRDPATLSPDDGYEVAASAFVYGWAEGKALKPDQFEEIKLI
ncbi:hypothetical protein Hte_010360 [Hypoxylon texense]